MKVRTALFSCLACLCPLVLVSPVRAQGGPPGGGSSGQWVITYDYAATGTQTRPNLPPLWGQISLPIDHTETGNTGTSVGVNSYWAGQNFQTAQISYTNTITAHLKWMHIDSYDPSGNPVWKPAPNAPKKVYIAKSSYVNWNKGTVETYAGSTASGSCSDGLGDPDAETAGSGYAFGTHVIQKKSSSGSVDITCQQSASCTVTDGTPTSPYSQYPGFIPHYQSEAFVRWSFSVALTDRSVSISREGAHDEWTDDDGNTHGDTIRSYKRTDPLFGNTVTTPVVNWQQFDAVLSGSWHTKIVMFDFNVNTVPDVSYQWQPAYSAATMFWNQWSQKFGQQNWLIDHWNGSSGGPDPDTMTYTATDNQDGISATAVYYLTRHDIYEEMSHHTDNTIEINERPAGSGNINNPSDKNMDVLGGYYEVSGGWSLGINFQPDLDVDGWQLANLGLSLSYTYTVATNAGQNCPGILLPPHTYTYLTIKDTYTRPWGTAYKWDAGGFAGEVAFDFQVPRPAGYSLHMHEPISFNSNAPGGGGGSGGA